MNQPTDWMSAIAILSGGLILGLLFVYFFTRRKGAQTLGGETDLARKDLEAKRDALVQQLRALDPDTPEDERVRLEQETAAVLRLLDENRAKQPTAAGKGQAVATEAVAPTSAMSPALQGVLWGAGSFLLLAGLAYFVMKQSTPKEQQGMGGMQQPPMAQQQPPTTNPVVLQLEAAVQKDPNNLQLRNDLAQAYLETDNLMGVFEQTKVVLAKEPENSRALAFQGLVRLAMGEADAAVAMLQRATKSDRSNLDAWVGLAWVYMQTNKPAEAEAAIAEAKKVSPENAAKLDDVLRQMKSQPAQQASAQELPAGHPPIDGAPAPGPAAATPAPAAAGGKAIRISLEIDPSAASRANMNGVLYVIARSAPGAPPVAVKRLDPKSLPMTIDLSQADSMMGQPIPDKVRIEARLDSDGDAATKPPTDPAAAQDGVTAGSAIKLALK